MMWDYIEQMRAQPLPVRRRYALLLSFSFTGVVALVWISVQVGTYMSSQSVPDDTADEVSELDRMNNMWQYMTLKFSDVRRDVASMSETIATSTAALQTYGASTTEETSSTDMVGTDVPRTVPAEASTNPASPRLVDVPSTSAATTVEAVSPTHGVPTL